MSSSIKSALTMLRLSVNNHPGVMSHICGLFAGRAYNLEGIPRDARGRRGHLPHVAGGQG